MSDEQDIDRQMLTDAQIIRMAERWAVDVRPNASRILNFARELLSAEARLRSQSE